MSTPALRGPHSVSRVLKALLDRPKRGERALPLVCLIGQPAAERSSVALARRLADAEPPKVLFARVDAENPPVADVSARQRPPLLPLLVEVRDRLAEDRFGDQRVRAFPHFRLVDDITRQTRDGGLAGAWRRRREEPDPERVEAGAAARAALPPWAQFFLAIFVAWHRPVRYWLWSRGVWPFGAEPRWLMRQRFALPGHSTGFVGFAERLAAQRDHEEDEQGQWELKKLLVHAFLNDLRTAYGTGTFRLRRFRRTMYPLVLLNNVTEDNAGGELLHLINDVRKESPAHAPLLVVATMRDHPQWLTKTGMAQPVHRIGDDLDAWVDRPNRKRLLGDGMRVITVDLSPDDDTAVEPIHPRPVPVLARRSSLVLATVIALALAATTGGSWLWPRITGDCLPSPRAGVGVRWVEDARGGECVGYSDSAAQVFGDNQRLRAAQRAIFELNEKAEDLHAVDPDRPLVSIVYFSELTNPEGELGSADSVTEQLTGLLLRQSQDNVPSDHNGPLLRVLIANGGYEMNRAREVTDDFLIPLFTSDPSLMGVVGMGRTVDPVETAIAALGDNGIPVIGTTLTGDSVATRSPMYFQFVPGNRAQAAIVKAYVDRSGRPVDVYQQRNIPGDGYLASLRAELAAQVGEASFRYWDGAVSSAKPLCGNRIAVYAGRQAAFDGFLDRVLGECAGNLPTILGGDTVARFVAQPDKRDDPDYAGKEILYVSLGGVAVLDNRDWLSSTPPSTPTALCSALRDLRRPTDEDPPAWRALGALLDKNKIPWIGERVAIAYDSAGLFLHAIRWNQSARTHPTTRTPNRAAISHELLELTCPTTPDAPRGNCYDGASGAIDFRAGRAGDHRPITILRVPDVKNTAEPPTCVLMLPDDTRHC